MVMLCMHSKPSSHWVYYVHAEQIYSTNPLRDKGKANECSLSQHWHEYVTHSALPENMGTTARGKKHPCIFPVSFNTSRQLNENSYIFQFFSF